jgi:hypothetical protein
LFSEQALKTSLPKAVSVVESKAFTGYLVGATGIEPVHGELPNLPECGGF